MNKVLIILGSTAVGKSKVALKVADKLNGEIILADSRQLYKYMDIGTAKPSLEEQRRIPHHLIDIIKPDQNFSAAEYAKRAKDAIRKVFEKNKQPIVVGGSGLYIRALTKGFFEGPSADVKVRKKLEKQAKKKGNRYLYEKLKEIDLVTAKRMHPNDLKKIIRALEIYELTGKTMTQLQEKGGYSPIQFEFLKAGLKLDRKELYQRINQRVDTMLSQGLLEEVKNLKEMGYTPELNALNTVGYKELFAYLKGEANLEEAIKKIKQNTRNYAKRQITWFKKDKDIVWFDVSKNVLVEEIIESFKEGLSKNQKIA